MLFMRLAKMRNTADLISVEIQKTLNAIINICYKNEACNASIL